MDESVSRRCSHGFPYSPHHYEHLRGRAPHRFVNYYGTYLCNWCQQSIDIDDDDNEYVEDPQGSFVDSDDLRSFIPFDAARDTQTPEGNPITRYSRHIAYGEGCASHDRR